jgi:hypothetical protein
MIGRKLTAWDVGCWPHHCDLDPRSIKHNIAHYGYCSRLISPFASREGEIKWRYE